MRRGGGRARRPQARGTKTRWRSSPASGCSVAASTISPRGPARAGAKVGGCAVAMVMISCGVHALRGSGTRLGDEVAVTAVVEQSAGVVEELADGDPAAVADAAG